MSCYNTFFPTNYNYVKNNTHYIIKNHEIFGKAFNLCCFKTLYPSW